MATDPSYPVAGYQPERAEALHARIERYKSIFISYWWILVLTVLIGLLVQLWITISRPTSWVSDSKLIVSGRIALPEGAMFSEEAIHFFGTQIELMRSGEVQRRARQMVQSRRPGLQPVPVNLQIDQLEGTSIFLLRASAAEPEFLQAYLNAVMEAYIEVRQGIFSQKSQSTLNAITEELLRLEGELEKSEDALLAWQRENNLLFLREEGNSAGAYLAQLNRNLAALQTEYNLLDQLTTDQNLERIATDEEVQAGIDPGALEEDDRSLLVGGTIATDFRTARRRLLLQEAALEQLLEHRREGHPIIVDARREIDAQKRLLEILREQGAAEFRSRRDSIAVQIRNNEEQIERWEKKALDLSQRMGEFDRLKGVVDRRKSLHERLLASLQSVDVNANIQQDIVSIMEYASPPVIPLTDFARELSTGVLAGAMLGLGILFVLVILDDRLVSVAELQTAFDENVIGIVPKVPEGRSLLHSAGADPPAPGLLEAFRNLRSWIFLLASKGQRPKTIIVTSGIPGEGKSTITTNLAVVLAASGSKTLLVDADLHRGQVHKIFQVRQQPGLGDVLAGTIEPCEAITTSDEPNLDLLTRGSHFGQGADSFMHGSLDHFLEVVSDKYDFVVFDTCPVLPVDDTAILTSKVDLTLVVVRASFSGARLTKKAIDLLEARQAKTKAIVFNCVSPSSRDYPYYQYYGPERGESAPLKQGA